MNSPTVTAVVAGLRDMTHWTVPHSGVPAKTCIDGGGIVLYEIKPPHHCLGGFFNGLDVW
ncbi:hypothetical protein [Rhodococcus jostii]|uniref:hypothetical protein n=1 Tax=Rhodococcus jostii TaxID=132919 RepID=UPI00363B9F72